MGRNASGPVARRAPHRPIPDPTAEGEALLLQRLSERSLADVADAEVADAELSNALADLGGVAAPAEIPSTATKLAGMAEGIRRHREEAGAARSVPQRQVAAALDFLASLANDPAAGADRSLCHGDLHYLNVLRDRGDAGWRVIDPLPSAGLREIDVVAALRNRYDDALATGDPDRALARRCDRLCEAGGLDRTVARALSQAVAVDNLLWLLPRDPTNAFVAPYAVLTGWH